MVEVSTSGSHKYLGRKLPGDLLIRSATELSARVQSAWSKFHKHRQELTDKHVSVCSRLKLFQSVVTPSALFGLAACSLTSQQVEKLDAVQRRMLRSLVGWTRVEGEDWAVTMRRMRDKVNKALAIYPVAPWSKQLAKQVYRYSHKIASHPESWPHLVARWHPHDVEAARRSRGRPRLRWDDLLDKFSMATFGRPWLEAAGEQSEWLQKENDFVNFIQS